MLFKSVLFTENPKYCTVLAVIEFLYVLTLLLMSSNLKAKAIKATYYHISGTLICGYCQKITDRVKVLSPNYFITLK